MNDQIVEADIFKRMKAGGPIRKNDPEYGRLAASGHIPTL